MAGQSSRKNATMSSYRSKLIPDLNALFTASLSRVTVSTLYAFISTYSLGFFSLGFFSKNKKKKPEKQEKSPRRPSTTGSFQKNARLWWEA
jgi:hypothetical protein